MIGLAAAADRIRGPRLRLGTRAVSRRTRLGAPESAPDAGCCVQHTCVAPCSKQVAQWVAEALLSKANCAGDLYPMAMNTPSRDRVPPARAPGGLGPAVAFASLVHEALKAPWNRRSQENQTRNARRVGRRSRLPFPTRPTAATLPQAPRGARCGPRPPEVAGGARPMQRQHPLAARRVPGSAPGDLRRAPF